MQEAYLAIRRDLGPEAVIVATRQVRQPGLKGLFLPLRLEVTAALDTSAETKLPEGLPDIKKAKVVKVQETKQPQLLESGDNLEFEGSRWHGLEGLRRELAEIKGAISRIAGLDRSNPATNYTWPHACLLKQELESNLVAALLEGIEDKSETKIIRDIVRTRLADCLAGQVATESHKQVKVFVGPTGVGKTTTLAKLAAHFSIYREQTVGLVTMDTYRIGAVEQLRTYAEIMGLPLEVVMTPREFREALERLEECDVILVDTAGRAPSNKAMIAETKGFLEVIPEGEVYLVLSCTSRCRDLLHAVESFRCLKYNRLVFTKLDETSCPGVIVTVTLAAGVPLSYLATGQSVPDDLEQADPYLIAQRIWEAVENNGSSG